MGLLNKEIKFRISEEEYKKFEIKVQDSGYNKSEFFRNIILKNKTKIVNKHDAIQIIYHLNKIGNNLNQQTHGLNKAFMTGKLDQSLFEQNLKVLNDIYSDQKMLIELLLYANQG